MPRFSFIRPNNSRKTAVEWSAMGRTLPSHVAIIMDGNGRWAARRALPREMGHRSGINSMREIIRESGKLKISALTLYAFSTENWSRPADEVSALMSLMLDCFRNEIDELDKMGVRVRVIGDITRLPEAHRQEILSSSTRTANNTGLRLNLALNYGGRDELVRAARALACECMDGKLKPEDITQDLLASRLDTAGLPDVDLLIRTSGEMRVSNFLPYQSAYAELVVTPVLWPDFTIAEYHKALDEFMGRGRRFGGRSPI